MYVKDHMTQNPITVTKEVSISKALDIMHSHHFHRLPVVDRDGQLIGLVTEGLVSEASGRNATSLSIYELNYLLSRTTVAEMMIQDVKTIDPHCFLEEAAQKMLDEGINVLPVVEGQKVVGIITEKDIFEVFVNVMGLGKQGTRFVLDVKDVPGEFTKITGLFAQANANLENIAVYHTTRGAEVVVKATGEIPVEEMMDILTQHGYHLTNVVQTTKEGKLVKFTI